MKKRKIIVTQKIRFFQTIDRLVWGIPIIILLYLLIFGFWGDALKEFFTSETSFGIRISFIIMLLFVVAFMSLPFMIIWRAVSLTLKKSALKNTTFNVLQDFDYYRDKLTGVSPVAISLLTDLDIEPKKDITALILKYTLMGVVSTDGNNIRVINFYHPDLKDSDKYLISAIAANSLNSPIIARWKEMAKQEVVQSGYIIDTHNNSTAQSEKNCASSCVMGCGTPILLFMTICFLLESNFNTFEEFADSLSDHASNIEVIQGMLSDSNYTFATLIMGILVLMLIVALILPIAALIFFIVKSRGIRTLKRTELGNELTEQIYGMKNFIHDFSNLSDADKEQLVLWDDFLIYAVLLEENTSIINEIFSIKKVKPFIINVI